MLEGVLSQFDQNSKNCLPTSFQDANTIQLNPRLILTIRTAERFFCICY